MSLQNGQADKEKTGTEFKDKLAVLGRMVMTGSGVAFALFSLLGVLNADQVKQATPLLQDIVADVTKLASDLYALWGIVGISLLLAAGKLGFGASSFVSKLKSITNNKLFTSEGSKIVVPESVAVQVPSSTVVGPLQGGAPVPPGAKG